MLHVRAIILLRSVAEYAGVAQPPATKDEPATGTYKDLADRIALFINES